MRRTVTALLAAALTVPMALSGAAPASAASYDRARSAPREDSYYPAEGDPGIDALHYGLDLTWLPASSTLRATARIELRATATADSFQLDLGEPLRVTRVRLAPADGSAAAVPVPSTHVGKDLVVSAPVVADQRYLLEVAYEGSPAPVKAPTSRSDMPKVGWHTLGDGQVWSMQEPFGAFTWYPVNDQPSDKAYYDVRLDVPGRWVGVSNGKMTSRRTAGHRTVTTFHNADPMSSYLMTVAIGPYRRYTQSGPGGIPMSYWVPRRNPELVKPLMRTPGALRWLVRRLGPYPFDRVGIVVTPSDSAMETQTMITFGVTNFRYGARETRRTVVHELAHSWYGDTVTPADWRDVWMNEGMATYQDTRWAVDQGWTTWRHWQRQWKRDDGLWRDVYGPPGAYDKRNFAAINVYYCPALMWDRLRIRVGTHEFNRLVRRWVQVHRDTNQTRASLERWWEQRTGQDLTRFFRRWLMSTRSPA